jgi:RNA polymerase sigma factor (sigma-70 family)
MKENLDIKDINIKYMNQIFRYIVNHVHHYELAEDLTQQTFLKVWERRANLDPDKSIIPYLYKTALNEIKMHYRNRKKVDSLSGSLELIDPITVNNYEKEQDKLLLNELSKMSQFQQELITLRYMNQMSLSEISQIVGKSIIATRVALHRALQKLKRNITDATKET